MKKILDIVPRWLPALLMMITIFTFSSRTSNELPNFGGWDYFVKKSAHGKAFSWYLIVVQGDNKGRYFFTLAKVHPGELWAQNGLASQTGEQQAQA